MTQIGVILLAAGLAQAERAGILRVEHAVLNRQAEADNGTAHVYVHNMSNQQVHIESVIVGVDGLNDLVALAVMPDAHVDDEAGLPYIWWRALPNPIEPNGYADLAVKLSRLPTSKIQLRFGGTPECVLEQQLDRINDPLGVCFIGYTPSRDTVYIYIESRLDEPFTLRRIRVNGDDATPQSRCIPRVIPPQGKGVIVVRLHQPLEMGRSVFLQIGGDPEAKGVALTRVVTGFPVTWIDGTLPEGLVPTTQDTKIRPGAVRGEGIFGYENIMRCPAHAHGTRQNAAAQYIAAYDKLVRSEPRVPGMIYVCRWEKEINYFVFAELGDAVRVMPFAGSLSYVPEPLNHSLQWLTALAVQAAAPRPVHAVVPIRFEDSYQWMRSMTPDEVRAMIYLPLSRGVKGLCYGRKEAGLSREAQQELAQVTREIAVIRNYLAFAEPMPWGRAEPASVEAATLLAGDQALILLIINHAFVGFDNDHVLDVRPQSAVRAEVMLPDDLQVADVHDVTGRGRPVKWQQQGPKLVIEVDRLIMAHPYLVLFKPDGQAGSPPSTDGR